VAFGSICEMPRLRNSGSQSADPKYLPSPWPCYGQDGYCAVLEACDDISTAGVNDAQTCSDTAITTATLSHAQITSRWHLDPAKRGT
jgi:hypothetical protein